MPLTYEQQIFLEMEYNVWVNRENNLFNTNLDSEYGWRPIPQKWLDDMHKLEDENNEN